MNNKTKFILVRLFAFVIFTCIYLLRVLVYINGWGLEPEDWLWIIGGYFGELFIIIVYTKIIAESNRYINGLNENGV